MAINFFIFAFYHITSFFFFRLCAPQTLYSLLPALLDTNPFSSEDKEKEGQGADGGAKKEEDEDDVSTLPAKVARLVEVYRCSLVLSREACLSPPLTSQTFGYLFFFTNTSLLNTLLERGETLKHMLQKHLLCSLVGLLPC